MVERIDNLKRELFTSNPAELICQSIKTHLLDVEEFAIVFGDRIDDYLRMDYSMRNLPVLRIYNHETRKEFDSWFVEGNIIAEAILPAGVRRDLLQSLTDILSSAMLQQFRRPSFFNLIEQDVPGLNELGKSFSIDKSLAMDFEGVMCPVVVMRINFRVDLREWDLYLESTDRTKDEPFKTTLGDLKKLVTTIQALRDDDTLELTIGMESKVRT